MKKLAVRREHRINETQAESAIKDYVDHVADIAKLPDRNRGAPDFDTPVKTPCPPASTPDRCRAGIRPTCRTTTGFASCSGCLPGAARKTAKPSHPALGASPRGPGLIFDRPPPTCATARAASDASYRSPTPLMMTRSAGGGRGRRLTDPAVTAPRPGQPGRGTRPLAAARARRHRSQARPSRRPAEHDRKAGARRRAAARGPVTARATLRWPNHPRAVCAADSSPTAGMSRSSPEGDADRIIPALNTR